MLSKRTESKFVAAIGISIVCVGVGCVVEDREDEVERGARIEVTERSATIEFENGNVLVFEDQGDGVGMLEEGHLPNAPVLGQGELIGATPAEVFLAVAGDREEVPEFLRRHHDGAHAMGEVAAWAEVSTRRSAGWLRNEIDGEHAWRAAADCVNATFEGLNCEPNSDYIADECWTDETDEQTNTRNAVRRYRGAVCGEGGSFNDLLRYKATTGNCTPTGSWIELWNQAITEDEYRYTAWWSGIPYVARQYEHTSSGVGVGDSYDWASMWSDHACEG